MVKSGRMKHREILTITSISSECFAFIRKDIHSVHSAKPIVILKIAIYIYRETERERESERDRSYKK